MDDNKVYIIMVILDVHFYVVDGKTVNDFNLWVWGGLPTEVVSGCWVLSDGGVDDDMIF